MNPKIKWWKTKPNIPNYMDLRDLIERGDISRGRYVQSVEGKVAELLGTKHVIIVPSGSAALLLALLCLDIKKEQNIVLPNCSWVATLNVARIFNCEIRFCDVEPDTGLMMTSSVKELIDDKTACVIVVHLNGLSVDTKQMKQIIGNIPIIEDACQAFGSRRAGEGFIGGLSEYACFSFGVTKLITCGQGGCLATNSEKVKAKALLVLNNGVDSLIDPKYICSGLNLKISGLSCLMLNAQLDLFLYNIRKVWEIYHKYSANLGTKYIEFPKRDHGEIPLYTQAFVKDNKRESLMKFLKNEGIETRPAPKPYDTAQHLKDIKVIKANNQGAKMYAKSILYLPSGPGQDSETISKVIDSINMWETRNTG